MDGASAPLHETGQHSQEPLNEGNGYIYTQAMTICDAARARGVVVRLLGATAFMNHCPRHAHLYEETNRKLTDVDLMSYSRTPQDRLDAVFRELGYEPIRALGWHAASRDIYINDQNLHVDVFKDVLAFSHRISFRGRLELDYPTIPLIDLLLEKLQIVQINPKDLFDVAVLLLEHELGHGDRLNREMLDIGRATAIWSRDWGFCHTATANLKKTHAHVDQVAGFNEPQRAEIRSKIERLLGHVEAAPKSVRWRLRATIGTRLRWYEEVEEVER